MVEGFPPRITALIVTYNRPDYLRQVIAALQGQTRPPDHILVFDNASTLPAAGVLADFSGLEILRNPSNIGGAGGFAAGIAHALKGGAKGGTDWLWLMDDDAVPYPDALEKMLAGLAVIKAQHAHNQAPVAPIGALCGAVYEENQLALPHRRHFNRQFGVEWYVGARYYQGKPVPIDMGSFVGFLLSSNAARQVGVPHAAFFLAYDDTEYALRLKQAGFSNWLVPMSKINHLRPAAAKLSTAHFSSKHCYNIRNRIAVLRRYAAWPFFADNYAVLCALAIWLRCGGLKNPRSFTWLRRALRDGRSGILGEFILGDS